MEFRIADPFTDSLAKLTGDEQKAVKTTGFDLQMNPANPGMQFHRLDKAKDKRFWSVRAGSDIRLIVYRKCRFAETGRCETDRGGLAGRYSSALPRLELVEANGQGAKYAMAYDSRGLGLGSRWT